jgi:hypothetical protein
MICTDLSSAFPFREQETQILPGRRNRERRRLDKPTDASLSALVCSSVPFGPPPHRLGLNLAPQR